MAKFLSGEKILSPGIFTERQSPPHPHDRHLYTYTAATTQIPPSI